jgi:L-asparaginase
MGQNRHPLITTSFDGFVVLHGSDTLFCISIEFYARKFSKACNFTGSQLPIGDLRTDAKENLITAIKLLCEMKTVQ